MARLGMSARTAAVSLGIICAACARPSAASVATFPVGTFRSEIGTFLEVAKVDSSYYRTTFFDGSRQPAFAMAHLDGMTLVYPTREGHKIYVTRASGDELAWSFEGNPPVRYLRVSK